MNGQTVKYGCIVMEMIATASKLSKVHQTSLMNTLTVMLTLILVVTVPNCATELVLKKKVDNSDSVLMFEMNREYPTDRGYFSQIIVSSDLKALILTHEECQPRGHLKQREKMDDQLLAKHFIVQSLKATC